jgi:hypothetical protein
VNDYHSKNGKDHHWEITNKFSYRIDRNWLPYLELQWLDRWNDYNREQYRIRWGYGIRSNKKKPLIAQRLFS